MKLLIGWFGLAIFLMLMNPACQQQGRAGRVVNEVKNKAIVKVELYRGKKQVYNKHYRYRDYQKMDTKALVNDFISQSPNNRAIIEIKGQRALFKQDGSGNISVTFAQ